MKFSSVLFFASLALAAPASLVKTEEPALEQRQNDPASVVATALNSAANIVSTSSSAIQGAVKGIKGNVDAQAQVLIRANIVAIADALKTAKDTIISSTVDATGSVTNAATGLTQEQVNNLATAIQNTLAAVNQLKVIVTLTASDLTPEFFALVKGELDLVKEAISPFVKPVTAFGSAVSKFSAKAGVSVVGLSNATNTLINVTQSLLSGLGLGGLGSIMG